MRLRALDRKMLRDLWQLRGQSLAIALVMACGIALYIMFLATLDSLHLSRASFYQDYRFADVFVSLKRAPASLRARVLEIPGVVAVETRVVASVNLDVAGFGEPVTGRVVSIPEHGEPLLNALFLRSGRLVEAGHDDEVVISETFAQAHGFEPGDKLDAILNGRRRTLSIVGTAISPEYIYQLRPGSAWPDYKRYGIMWMGERAVASVFDMEGAFNNVTLRLGAGARQEEVIDRLDELLRPYGGFGAYGRADQLSHNFLDEEFKQLQRSATMFPVIFLGIAAFLLNVVIGRMVATQREQIAALKAFGYGNPAIGLHYTKLVLLIVCAGALAGVAAGIWLAQGMSGMYMQFFRFPYLLFDLQPRVILGGVLATAAAALLGTFYAVRAGARLHPAEAMRPAPPTVYRLTWFERLGVGRRLSQPSRMILRHIERRPFKSLLTVIGIAFACGINMTGQFQEDTVSYMMDAHYGLAQRQDLSVIFTDPSSQRALHALQRLAGVERAEGFRLVPVRLRHGQRAHRTAIMAFRSDGDLRRLVDEESRPVRLPERGLVLTDYLGQMLGVREGDVITVEILEGSRPLKEVPVVALVKEYLGVSAYMELEALNRLMKEGHALSGAYLAIDAAQAAAVYESLKQMPRVAGITQRQVEIENFNKTMDETMLFITSIATVFAVIISFGVVYNSARISLTERSHELASLRVLGLTRAEISYILLGELALLTLVAIPIGWVIGYGLSAMIAANLQSELYRVPTIIDNSSYAFATTVVLVSALLSGLLVRRRLDRLDLIAVLKTKE